MARVLRRTVVAGGVTYPAGTAETADLRDTVSNAKAWEGESDLPETETETEGPSEPPRGGAGATADAWREYATALELEVPDGASRDEIVALVDARNSDS